MNKSLDSREMPYPAHVLLKRVRGLTLNDSDFTRTRITSLTKEQFEGISYVRSKKDKLDSWEKDKLKDLYKSLNNYKLRYNLRTKAITIRNLEIKLSNIALLSPVDKCNNDISKHFKYTIIRGNKYWYNYGGNFYDYYGVGLQEVNAAWKTILQVISCDTHFIIFKTNRR